MADLLRQILGDGTELGPLQMSARAVIVFFAALAMIRVAGRRSHGQHSAFDACIAMLLGAVLSRAVVGASPFASTLAAGLVLVVMHRLVAWCGVRWSAVERVLTGRERVLVERGIKNEAAMLAALISEGDLREAMRKRFGDDDLQRLEQAVLERDGEVSLRRRPVNESRTTGAAGPGSRPDSAP
jgi:uncharacterized membrane protein YcaP (DUF421 family)